MHHTAYANSLGGAAQYALDQWKFFRAQYDIETDQQTKDIYNGRLYSYADILQQITGSRLVERWEEIVGLMAQGLLS
jgi:hypothetical protein